LQGMTTKGAVSRVRARARRSEHRWADRIEERLPGPVRALASRLRQDDILLLSAGLGFYAVVSLVPLVVLIASLASLIVGDQRIHQLAMHLGQAAPKSLGADQALRQIAQQGSRVSVVAFVSGLWPATAYGAGLVRAFDDLSPQHRGGPKSLRGRGLALIVLLPLFVAGGIVGSYAGWVILGSTPAIRVAGFVLALVAAFLGAGGAIVLIYWVFPPQRLGWRPILAGTGAAAGSISVLSLVFTLYLTLGANFQEHYATSGIAAFVLLALWLFLANAMVLVGYKIALEVAGKHRPRSKGS
jgi:membrane protein